ncbi:OleI family self-immunity macrolide glycosyltransferase [Streptomyces sp. NBC_00287]|uniref:macrolide family glycosyltransferase n=1 Tax=Streptomyces sp. NBC_00287 TaxID=2975702 RepID=UPI002E2B9147|nr:macrolide family glycosyltransferase [Streptomyces sp. NBC_00287]
MPAEGGHVAVFTAAAYSHINPLLGTVAELVRRGLKVSYATTREFAPLVETAGATAVVFRSALPSDPAAWPTDTRRLPLLYLDDARATLPELAASFTGDRPDLVLTEDPAGAGSVLAAKWGIPSMQVWTYLAAARHWSLTEPGTATANPVAAEFLSRLGKFLAQEGLTATAREHLTTALAGGLVLIPRSFQPDGDSFGAEYTFTGPAPAPEPQPPAWTPPESKDPVVLVSLGSIDHAHPEFFTTVAEAFTGLPWHVVMATGDRCAPPQLPPNVEAHSWVPNTAVLRHAELAIHHGGMATTMEALHHGVPSLVVPRLPEQTGNARRVRELGLGTAIPFRSVTPTALRTAVLQLHAHEGVRRRVNAMREEIRRSGGARAAADAVVRRLTSA